PNMQAVKTIGLDIAKSGFQVHGVDADGQVVFRRQLKRRYVLAFFRADALQMSAFDPKRTFGSSLNESHLNRYDALSLPEGGNETARVHRYAWRRGGVAARAARAATREDAAHRYSHVSRRGRSSSKDPHCSFHRRVTATGLDGRP